MLRADGIIAARRLAREIEYSPLDERLAHIVLDAIPHVQNTE